MQKEISSTDGGNTSTTAISSPLRSHNHRISLSPPKQSDGIGFTSLYSSIFPPKTSLPNSVSLTPSASSCDEDNNNNANATENRLYLARLILEYHELVDRYSLCLTHLQETAKETEALRQENANLRMANKDLIKRFSLLTQASIHYSSISAGYPSLSIVDDFRRLCIGDNFRNSRVPEDISVCSPTSVIGSNRFERMDPGRVSLPKSISIRSSGYLKMNQAGGSNGCPSRSTNRLRVPSPVIGGTASILKIWGFVNVFATQQRVYMPEEKKDEEPLELEAYSQGMFKTELCNKWQETGTCPYEDQCQFAHGIPELRPVIRHQRYKTEVCRMVLGGDRCPYGHRCHFRHALTEQERFMGPNLN
ncbi:hypothetical protein HHK36_030010 [Tetracentron sinense]|uniref:C3H1-type domain-containing protein n=1 Tax=Tetracentron sinense TaxID=13715 RepID=A0A834YEV0_TETSI|nr:hypothetical protein HHK36_030010 [Tetracentron sinense]